MKPKPARPREVERIIIRLGFVQVRSSGSHRFYRHPDGRIVTVAFHPGDIPLGTLRAIISQIGLNPERFSELL